MQSGILYWRSILPDFDVPVSSGAEFINTFTHEILHLAVNIATGEKMNLKGEFPAYVAGDTAGELSDILCYLGCVPGIDRL